MYLDERIALLDRMRRMNEQEEVEAVPQENKGLSMEQTLESLSNGKLKLEDGSMLEFELQTHFPQKIPFVCFKDFYQASREEKEALILVNHDKAVSQIMTFATQERVAKTLDQWANLLVNGMAANRMYAKVLKKVSLEKVEYICFEVPAAEKWVWNIIFRFKDKWLNFNGNYNCLKQDTPLYGMLLEAMVVQLNQWVMEQEGMDVDGK